MASPLRAVGPRGGLQPLTWNREACAAPHGCASPADSCTAARPPEPAPSSHSLQSRADTIISLFTAIKSRHRNLSVHCNRGQSRLYLCSLEPRMWTWISSLQSRADMVISVHWTQEQTLLSLCSLQSRADTVISLLLAIESRHGCLHSLQSRASMLVSLFTAIASRHGYISVNWNQEQTCLSLCSLQLRADIIISLFTAIEETMVLSVHCNREQTWFSLFTAIEAIMIISVHCNWECKHGYVSIHCNQSNHGYLCSLQLSGHVTHRRTLHSCVLIYKATKSCGWKGKSSFRLSNISPLTDMRQTRKINKARLYLQ